LSGSSSLARGWKRPSQANDRSTTQWRGKRTKLFLASESLTTISSLPRSNGWCADRWCGKVEIRRQITPRAAGFDQIAQSVEEPPRAVFPLGSRPIHQRQIRSAKTPIPHRRRRISQCFKRKMTCCAVVQLKKQFIAGSKLYLDQKSVASQFILQWLNAMRH
jgi:hypothetical protein